MPYENFPYADLHNLNLDWLLKQVKEDHDLLSGTDFEGMVEAAVQEAIDDGRLADLINDTLLRNIRDRLILLDGKVDDQGDDIKALELKTADGTVTLLGCPAASTLDPARGYSLCMVIQSMQNVIVYDMGNDNAQTLLTYLASKGIGTVAAFIISHYHSDHVQVTGVSNVCSAINVLKWYLPHSNINWASYVGTPSYESVESSVKAAITAGGDAYLEPSAEGQEYNINDKIKVQFYNLDPAYYTDYYSYMRDEDNDPITHTNYNNFSMCARVYIGGKVLALTGDIELPAQEKMAGMIKGADVLQIPHHGLDLIDSEKFRQAMSGKIFLTAAYGVAREARLKTVANLMVQRAGELGASVSNVNGNTVECIMGGSGCYLSVTNPGTPTPSGCFGDVLRPGDDLDNLIEIGRVYFIQNASDASGISNIPETGAGKVYVMSCNQNSNDTTGSIMQYYEAAFSYAHPKIYVRWKYEGTWTSWMQYEATSI